MRSAAPAVAPTAPAATRPAPPPPPAPAAAPGAAAVHGSQFIPALQVGVPRERIYFGSYEVQPLSVMRQKIAEHMVASKHVSAHVYSVEEIDMSKIAALRAKSKEEFEKRYETKLTFMPFFVKATVAGLRAYPTLNASLDGTNMVLHREVNIGIAVALDWGLIVPVIKNADEKNLLGIQRNLNDLAERARSKKLKPEEVQEGTFSITNPGVFGGLFGLAGHQPAECRHSRPRRHRKASGGNQRQHRHSLDVLHHPELRPSRGRRRRRPPVPPQGQGDPRELVRTGSVAGYFSRFTLPAAFGNE